MPSTQINARNRAIIMLGGNMGDRKKNLATARELVAKNCGEILATSSLYETAAWGKTDQEAFINQALLLRTRLAATDLMQKLLEVEQSMGRQRNEKYGPRLIDIDIIFFNDEVIESDFLHLPHPQMHKRRFVLAPVNEIAPRYNHPVLNKKVAELLLSCNDNLDVTRLRDEEF